MQKDGDEVMSVDDWDTRLNQYFVDRPKAEDAIQKWLDSSSNKCILSVVAPPGNGKTWLLRRLYQQWGAPKNRLALWLNAPLLIRREETQDANQMIDTQAFNQWFQGVKDQAARHCDSLQSIGILPDFAAQVGALVKMVCNCSLDHSPVLIVDGYDEITEKQAETLNLRILQPFLAPSCTRLILAHRVEWKVQGLLSYRREVFFLSEKDPLSSDFAKEQFQTFFAGTHPGAKAPNPEDWMGKLQHYCWNHPFINHFLFERGLEGGAADLRPLTPQDFYDCCQAVIARPDVPGGPRYARLTEDEFNVLYQLAKNLPESWTEVKCTELLKISSMIMDSRLMRLFDAGVIANLPSTQANLPSSLYQVNNGIRGLLNEISDLSAIAFS
mgnify:CR=1 FL=1